MHRVIILSYHWPPVPWCCLLVDCKGVLPEKLAQQYQNDLSLLLKKHTVVTVEKKHVNKSWERDDDVDVCSDVQHFVARWITFHRRWSKGEHTTRKWICGASACCATSSWLASHRSRPRVTQLHTDAFQRSISISPLMLTMGRRTWSARYYLTARMLNFAFNVIVFDVCLLETWQFW